MKETEMETHIETLKSALAQLPVHEPSKSVWLGIESELSEIPLQVSIANLPGYQPADNLWDNIESKISQDHVPDNIWWFAAAVILVVGSVGILMTEQQKTVSISYSKETFDSRLQVANEQVTNQQFQKLKAYCESEALVCESQKFKRLKAEYETLNTAAEQLKNAMGDFNTEPQLVKQFNILEREKGDILNEMAKMI